MIHENPKTPTAEAYERHKVEMETLRKRRNESATTRKEHLEQRLMCQSAQTHRDAIVEERKQKELLCQLAIVGM